MSKPVIDTGTEVSVVYNPANPSEALIGDFTQTWLGPLVVSVAGLVFILMGIGAFSLMGDSDRAFAEVDRQAQKDKLVFRQDTVRIRGTIDRVQKLSGSGHPRYVLICKGLRPGESFEEEFVSEHFTFEPDSSFVGRTVEIVLDPGDRKFYLVELGLLLKEILALHGGA